MKILLTGGNGFIARHIFEQLNDRYDIVSLNSKELDLLDSVKVSDFIKGNCFDVVIHAATYDAAPKHSTKDPSRVLENNLRMFFNLARCRDNFDKMICFGSGAEFGREDWIPMMKENYFDQYIPIDQYGFSKYIMTKYAQANDGIYNLRLFAVFGKYEDWRVRIISSICRDVVLGLPVRIKQNKFYDFTHIDDLVRIVKWFIDNNPSQSVYNVCSGQVMDFKSIAEKVIEVSGKKLDIVIENDGLGKEYSGDNSLLLSELSGFEFNPLEESIISLYEWYDLNKQLIS